MNLIIDRAKWLRGEGGNLSRLLRPADGKMCCLGFLGLQCGYTPDQMLDQGEPNEMFEKVDREACAEFNRWPKWLIAVDEYGPANDRAVTELIATNDDRVMPESDREAQIAAIFAKHGVTVTFT